MSFIHEILPSFRTLEAEVNRQWRYICDKFPHHGHKRKHDPEATHIGVVEIKIINHKNSQMKRTQSVIITFGGFNAEGAPSPITGFSATIDNPALGTISKVDPVALTVQVDGIADGTVNVTPTGTNDQAAAITGPAVQIVIADVDTTATVINQVSISAPFDTITGPPAQQAAS